MLSRASTARHSLAAASRLAKTSTFFQARTFIAPTVSRRADFVQELYLKELKVYKTPVVKDSDAAGQVATFSAPQVPKSPEETDLAASLKEYESMAVEVEGQATAAPGAAEPVAEDWLVIEDWDAETPKHH